jgi:hypothetical protein
MVEASRPPRLQLVRNEDHPVWRSSGPTPVFLVKDVDTGQVISRVAAAVKPTEIAGLPHRDQSSPASEVADLERVGKIAAALKIAVTLTISPEGTRTYAFGTSAAALPAPPAQEQVEEHAERRKPGRKYKEDWPRWAATQLMPIVGAKRPKNIAKVADDLCRLWGKSHKAGNELDPKAVERVIAELFSLVRDR